MHLEDLCQVKLCGMYDWHYAYFRSRTGNFDSCWHRACAGKDHPWTIAYHCILHVMSPAVAVSPISVLYTPKSTTILILINWHVYLGSL